jgi:Domain of unknown function (DUF4190)
MSAPGGGFGEGAPGEEANPPAGGREPGQPDWQAPWDPPAPDHPPPAYSPPGYVQPPGHGGPPGFSGPPGYDGPPGPPQFGGPPSGYGPPPYPGGYYPAPDYPGGYAQPEAMRPGMNGLAIGSLISSFAGVFCCIGAIVAIVLGAIALDQIKRTRQDGYAVAVAGIVIGVATVIVWLIIAIFAAHSH